MPSLRRLAEEMSLLIKNNRLEEDHMESIDGLEVEQVEFCNLLERPYLLYMQIWTFQHILKG